MVLKLGIWLRMLWPRAQDRIPKYVLKYVKKFRVTPHAQIEHEEHWSRRQKTHAPEPLVNHPGLGFTGYSDYGSGAFPPTINPMAMK